MLYRASILHTITLLSLSHISTIRLLSACMLFLVGSSTPLQIIPVLIESTVIGVKLVLYYNILGRNCILSRKLLCLATKFCALGLF